MDSKRNLDSKKWREIMRLVALGACNLSCVNYGFVALVDGKADSFALNSAAFLSYYVCYLY